MTVHDQRQPAHEPADQDVDIDVERIIADMTLDEKLAQLVGLWLQLDDSVGEGGNIAPMQHEMIAKVDDFATFARHGVGQLTRPLGSQVTGIERMLGAVERVQQEIESNSRFAIPALVHEEILTGLQLYGATTYPTPLAWGSSWNPELVDRMGKQIGRSMRDLGIHLGLAPVLDVVRDPRWGRVEECIGEDPYLIGTIGSRYVQGVQSAGVGATLKHFLGYSGSQAGRNLAPVHAGRREVLETFSVPFEMAVRLAHPEAVMHSYAEIDGVPIAADPELLTGLLRDTWGFAGTVVADYFGVAFLHNLHDIAADDVEAAIIALQAGVDVELPTGNDYLEPLAEAVRAGRIPEAVVDRAVRRVLEQKLRLGVFGPRVEPRPVELDPAEARDVAAELAEQSVVLLTNGAETLPLTASASIAVVGPNADAGEALLGNYSFTNHVEVQDGTPLGIALPTVLERIRQEFPEGRVTFAPGTTVRAEDQTDEAAALSIAAAVAAARAAEVCVAVVGDRAGLFGRGTVGEGSDIEELELPGRQRDLVDALIATGTPVVVVLLTGRPYPVARWESSAAAIIQAFFPGEEGAAAIAGVLSGRVNPSGRLPVSMPKSAGGQPYTYRHPRLGGANPVSNINPAPAFPFGHGLSYTTFRHSDLQVEVAAPADTSSTITVSCTVENTGHRAGADVVQLYVRDVAASVTRPLRQLVGWARVQLDPGAAAAIRFTVPADRLALVGRGLRWQVEPGEFVFTVAPSATAGGLTDSVVLGGDVRETGPERELVTDVELERIPTALPAAV
ncbi:glycoside hydrolase family 3 N-terminal domain-containing protein [Leifsonia sp. fls2-241-R2A-40a]|uniref:glycoside hydrolase family 3 N-terminal domain-containing protein n=1 Tax=Leifsonia sp. fls2-241-R2A-40a TaxID=3040290 RepID=UPI00330677A6